jgi:hypothetical protein
MLQRKLKSPEELKQHLRFGENCRLCIPFVKLMIKTGRTEFEPSEVLNE